MKRQQTAPRRQKVRSLTIDERAATMLTGEEYRHVAQWARRLTLLAVVLCVALLGLAVRAGYVVGAQLAAQTSLVRPLTAEHRHFLTSTRGVGVTVVSTAHMRPAGWAARMPAALLRCRRVATCPPYVTSFTRFILRTSPDVRRIRGAVEQIGGAAVLIAPFALFASGEAARWGDWERRVQAANTRHRKRAAQKRRPARM